jgi:hypothetical protein
MRGRPKKDVSGMWDDWTHGMTVLEMMSKYNIKKPALFVHIRRFRKKVAELESNKGTEKSV